MSKTLKLCDGWKVFEDGVLVFETENYQEVREWLWIEEDTEAWSDITRELFCFGRCNLALTYCDDTTHVVTIKVIPCRD